MFGRGTRVWVWSMLVFVILMRATQAAAGKLELRGAWFHGTSTHDRASADALLDRAEMMHLNALYMLVFYWGATATYESDLLPKNSRIAPGFDPLGYMVEEGHKRGIEIHAWFVNGENREDSHIFQKRPEWMSMNLVGERVEWFDLCQEAVREWQTGVMLEVLEKYDVDGLHFDYIRFNGKGISTSPAARAAALEAGIDIEALTYATLPAYGQFSGNPLTQPTTARVLARFNDDVPAVAVNEAGWGEVVLFNWHVDSNTPGAIATAATNALRRLGVGYGGSMRILDSDINAVKYGHTLYERARDWIASLGFQPVRITDADIEQLSGSGAVVLPKHYLMTDAQAQALLSFVRNGGHALFLDGPVFAVRESEAARTLLGFGPSSLYFNGDRLLVAEAAPDQFVPSSNRTLTIEGAKEQHRAWDVWRKAQVTDLVAEVNRRAGALRPEAYVNAAVFYTKAAADAVLQDWPRWLEEGFLDYAIPMAYVETTRELEDAFDWWREIDPGLTHIVPGFAVYRIRESTPQAYAARVKGHVDVVRRNGAHGVVMFAMEHLDAATAKLIGETVFAQDVQGGGTGTGDFNLDGTVDFRDFIQFASHYGYSQGEEKFDGRYDLDGDGAVGFRDFVVFVQSYQGG